MSIDLELVKLQKKGYRAVDLLGDPKEIRVKLLSRTVKTLYPQRQVPIQWKFDLSFDRDQPPQPVFEKSESERKDDLAISQDDFRLWLEIKTSLKSIAGSSAKKRKLADDEKSSLYVDEVQDSGSSGDEEGFVARDTRSAPEEEDDEDIFAEVGNAYLEQANKASVLTSKNQVNFDSLTRLELRSVLKLIDELEDNIDDD